MSTYETMRAAHAEHSHNRASKIAKKRAAGGAVEGNEPRERLDRRAHGGKVGKRHGHVTVNVMAPQAPAPAVPPRPVMPPMGLAPPPGGAPPAMPPRPMPPPGMPPPGAPMMRPPGMKRGGGVKMTAGAGSGEGRLQKAKAGVKGLV